MIVDTKFYCSSTQVNRFGKRTLHSANLYQLQSYVLHAAETWAGPVSGLLLYARTDAPVQPEFDAFVLGHRLGATTLDLSQPWPALRRDLEAVLQRF